MTDRHLGDSRLDAAIDRAVREMMGAEPRADLRERVLAELAGPSARAMLWPRLAFGLAATVAAMIAVQVVQRPPAPPAEQTIGAMPAPSQSPGTESQAPLAPRMAPSVSTRGPARGNGSTAPTPPRTAIAVDRPIQATSIDTAEPGAGIAPMPPIARLNPIEAISVARLAAPQVSTPTIDLKPLAIEQMEIAPLTPRR